MQGSSNVFIIAGSPIGIKDKNLFEANTTYVKDCICTCWQVRKRAAQTNTPATPCASLFCKKSESSTTGDIVLHVAEVVGAAALLLVVVGLEATVVELDMVCNTKKVLDQPLFKARVSKVCTFALTENRATITVEITTKHSFSFPKPICMES